MKPLNYNKAAFLSANGDPKKLPAPDRLEFVFSGRSNVGKSSLINKLFNRKSLARVSAVPGKTATINFYSVEDVYFVDLPGYGYAKVSKQEKAKWGRLVNGYLEDTRRHQGMIFQLIDIRHPPTEDDLNMLDYLEQSGFRYTIVLTKADKLSRPAKAERLLRLTREIPDFEEKSYVTFSAINGEGVEELKEIIESVREYYGENDILNNTRTVTLRDILSEDVGETPGDPDKASLLRLNITD